MEPIAGDLDLARRHAPILLFDAREPFLPSAAGYTVFHTADAASSSFPRYVHIEAPAVLAIEYALWWDWDIQHLYELEHVWVMLDAAGTVVAVKSSQHGGFGRGRLLLEAGRPVLYAEPGKHALTSSRAELLARRSGTERACGPRAGSAGVLVTPLFQGRIVSKSPPADQLVRSYLRGKAFAPAWDWSVRVDVAELQLVPWPELEAAIPTVVEHRLTQLEATIPPARRDVLVVGHRGAGVHAPENTLAAIRTAAQLGAGMVELDVRLSADGVAVLSHDASVSLAGERVVPIGSLGAAELSRSSGDGETSVPALADALDVCEQAGIAPYLDLKESAAVDVAVAQLAGRGIGRYSVLASFEPAWVARAVERAPGIPTAVLFGGFEVDPLALARGCGARYVHPCWERHPAPHQLLTPEWLARVRAAGLGVVCWHEERPDVLAALFELGVTAICTDRLDLALAAKHGHE